MKKSILILGCMLGTIHSFSQSDIAGPVFGHQRIPGRYVGWSPGFGSISGDLQIRNNFNQPINLFTNNIWRASITTNNGLTNTNLVNYNFNVAAQTGDGIQVRAGIGSNPAASIDIFTSFSNQTFIRMDGTTLFQTTNNRFENISNLNGFWYNATGNGANGAPGPFIPQFIWNIQQNETGRLGNNNNWRFGLNPGGINANNRVEIVSGPTNPGGGSAATPGGSSGLRTTNMTSASPTTPNPGLGLVSVNAAGDLIYVPTPTVAGGGFGNVCGLGTNPLTNNWEIPQNGFNFRFAGNAQGTASNNVGIGTTCAPLAKLHVDQASGSTNGSIGILVRNSDQTSCTGQPVIGIKSVVSSTSLQFFKAAGWFEATNAPNCFGSVLQYAIVVPQNGGVVSLGYSPPSVSGAMLDVNGTVNALVYTGSDLTLKNTVTTLPNSLNLITRLRPVTFKWNTVTDTMMSGVHAGFIAQEVDTIIPQVVRTGNAGKKSVAYSELIPYLVSAIQSQQKSIDSLRTQLTALTSSVSSCCSSSAVRATTPAEQNQLTINLSDKDIIVLNQSVPNPFTEQTTITYNVPETYGYAQIVFSTIDGRILKTVDITKKGKGTLTVYSNDLSNGMYTYSLIVDGKTFDTKKMIKSE